MAIFSSRPVDFKISVPRLRETDFWKINGTFKMDPWLISTSYGCVDKSLGCAFLGWLSEVGHGHCEVDRGFSRISAVSSGESYISEDDLAEIITRRSVLALNPCWVQIRMTLPAIPCRALSHFSFTSCYVLMSVSAHSVLAGPHDKRISDVYFIFVCVGIRVTGLLFFQRLQSDSETCNFWQSLKRKWISEPLSEYSRTHSLHTTAHTTSSSRSKHLLPPTKLPSAKYKPKAQVSRQINICTMICKMLCRKQIFRLHHEHLKSNGRNEQDQHPQSIFLNSDDVVFRAARLLASRKASNNSAIWAFIATHFQTIRAKIASNGRSAAIPTK